MSNSQYGLASYCFNPNCLEPHNQDGEACCRACGANLLLQERYRGDRLLGQGGFGRTFLAIDQSQTPPLPCVIKQFWQRSPNLLQPQQAKLLFQQEVDRLRELGNHPQIPSLLDSFEQDGFLYLVQSYIAGENLAAILATKARFSVEEVWQLLESLLPILQFIHSHGVIHRDIKPENVIRYQSTGVGSRESGVGSGEQANSSGLTADSSLFLVDFGAAKLLAETPLLQPGTVIGSPEYAAPEQVKGKAVFASDLYSLGVTCIHLLTGMRPFNLFDFASNCWTWRDYCLADSNYTDDELSRLASILDRLIEPALNQRFSSAAAAIAAIQPLRGKRAVVPVPPPPPLWECYATLKGHQGLFANVNAIAIDALGSLLASASDDKTVRLWDIQTGAEHVILRGHTQFVKAVVFHPHLPNLLATGGSDRTIKIWDLQNQQAIYTLLGHQQAINAIEFSPDGTLLASGSSDKTIKLWNASTGSLINTLSGHTLAVNALAYRPHGQFPTLAPLLASVSSDRQVKIWNLLSWELVRTLAGHTAALRAVAFSPDGKLLATGGEDRTLRLWDTTTWECLRVLSGHPWSISALTFSPDGEMLISSSWDKTVKLWRVKTGKEIAVFIGHTDSVGCVAISPNGALIASGSQDQTIRLWRRCGNGLPAQAEG